MAGVISTPHTLATEAGMQMFRAGGNAVDAALAAAAVLTVVYPHQCALGGDAFGTVVGSPFPAASVLEAFDFGSL